jgi:hypothetical protein
MRKERSGGVQGASKAGRKLRAYSRREIRSADGSCVAGDVAACAELKLKAAFIGRRQTCDKVAKVNRRRV